MKVRKTCLDCPNYIYCRPDAIHWFFNVTYRCPDHRKDMKKEWDKFNKAYKTP